MCKNGQAIRSGEIGARIEKMNFACGALFKGFSLRRACLRR
jgi:hypothetical protein